MLVSDTTPPGAVAAVARHALDHARVAEAWGDHVSRCDVRACTRGARLVGTWGADTPEHPTAGSRLVV